MAIEVKRAMLDVNKYKWQASKGDNPTKVAHDRVMFSRREGCVVIPLIQKVVNHFGYETIADVRRVEEAIAGALPGKVRSRKNVFSWLVNYLS